jgi:small-conductance mechanosensitive channel
MFKRISQAVISQRKLIQRWVNDYAPQSQPKKPFERLSTLATAVWDAVKKIWSFEVMAFEDKVEVDGQTITGKIPITLGLFLRALLFFVIGYGVFSRIASRIQASLVTRGHIAEAQAKTLRNWAMIVVGVFLAIGTLSFLKIPLTVFAFFGGALAIGLGFGMQTLIKNFISGIIVLAERKVRVGDMLDVDGIVGTVTEINTRSSVIRGPDDVETMIPNSAFLENRVTNWTLTHAKMRRSLRVGVAYGTSPQKVMETLTESAGRHGLICKDPAPFAVFDDFGENSLVFSLYFWLDLRGATNAMIVTSDLRLMIEKRFAELDIQVPFPQRALHLNASQPLQIEWAKEPESNTWPPQNSK